MSATQNQGPTAAQADLNIESLERFWDEHVFGMPSVFARLVYLCRLWDRSARRYQEPTLEMALGAEGADRVIRMTHELTFGRWLNFSLEQQKADLEIYLHGASESGTVPTTRLRLDSYQVLTPASALPHERQLFLCDMAVIIDLIQTEQPRHRLERLALLAPLAERA